MSILFPAVSSGPGWSPAQLVPREQESWQRTVGKGFLSVIVYMSCGFLCAHRSVPLFLPDQCR